MSSLHMNCFPLNVNKRASSAGRWNKKRNESYKIASAAHLLILFYLTEFLIFSLEGLFLFFSSARSIVHFGWAPGNAKLYHILRSGGCAHHSAVRAIGGHKSRLLRGQYYARFGVAPIAIGCRPITIGRARTGKERTGKVCARKSIAAAHDR